MTSNLTSLYLAAKRATQRANSAGIKLQWADARGFSAPAYHEQFARIRAEAIEANAKWDAATKDLSSKEILAIILSAEGVSAT